ncbi:hypothetical protein LEP1GSC009_4415 [Leptospira interrogans serovar Grippotyphosa str. Andaman]|nr:hypothetical protein LEP1GSC009_4415 [Leptospira interrogans serovar Grippotyphosa str. Andaman]
MIVQFYNLGKSIPSVGIVESRFQFLFLPFVKLQIFQISICKFRSKFEILKSWS